MSFITSVDPLPQRPRSVHTSMGVPFYIFAPDYRHSSGGIRVLHYFCHLLNELGEEAYIVNARKVSPELRTPQLTFERFEEHFLSGRTPVTVYPEVVSNNPFDTPLIARWLLNIPGRLGKPISFEDKDLIFYYEPWCLPEKLSGEFLHVDPLDHITFSNDNNPDDNERTLECYYAHKYLFAGSSILEEHQSLTSLGQDIKRTPEEIASIFRKAKVLYCYEPSGIINEAQACGCPVLLMRSAYWPLPADDSHHQLPGCAVFGEDGALEKARDSLRQVRASHLKLRDDSWSGTKTFINKVYAALDDLNDNGKPCINEAQKLWALSPRARKESLESFRQHYLTNGQFFKDADIARAELGKSNFAQYNLLLSRTSLQEIDGQVLAERMANTWTTHPSFTLVVEARTGEEALLADTIDSIIPQWYQDWNLVIVANFPPLSEELASADGVAWVQYAGDSPDKSVIDSFIGVTNKSWLLHIEAGHTLEAHALAYFADYINLFPEAKLLYCDEDILCPDGKHKQPKLKPEFNLEMLRSSYYFGKCVALKREPLLDMGGWSDQGEAAVYDLALCLLDVYGAKAIGHVPHTLFHASEKILRELDAAAEQSAVAQHLLRNNLPAEVKEGLLYGTQQVLYTPPLAEGEQPKVSIIVLTHNQPGYLVCCLDSLLEETSYHNFELIVVDDNSDDPDALGYLEALHQHPRLAGRYTLLHSNNPVFNYAALANLGAEKASGDYLLFIDNDTEYIQKDWLERLVAYTLQPEVMAVGPRLCRPESPYPILDGGPRILGMGNSTAGGSAMASASMLTAGDSGRLQLAQDVTSLTTSCLLVRATAFRHIGGFDAVNTPFYEAGLDFCLRLTQAPVHGKAPRLIWTPYVDVAHHMGVTRRYNEIAESTRLALQQQASRERDYLIQTYLPTLAADPNYHPKLSLASPFAIESSVPIEWDLNFHNRIRLLGLPISGGSGEYRVLSPFRILQKSGLAQTSVVGMLDRSMSRILSPVELERAKPDSMLVQNAVGDGFIIQMRNYRKFNPGVFTVYSVDDALGTLPRKHHLYNYHAREGKYRLREGLSLSDRMIASTEPLRDYCKDMIEDIIVVPNRLEGAKWLQHKSQRGVGKKPRVGWVGAQQHLGDLTLIKDVVEALHKEVEWVFMGMCPDFIKPFVAEEYGWVSFEDYPAKVASLNLDLAIAPLEQHFFNEGKSNLRLLEYGVFGWPVVCTDIYPYQTNNAPVKRVQNQTSAWIEAIRERIHDLDAAYKEGDALHAWVMKHYILEDHIQQWLDALSPAGFTLLR